MKCKICGNQNGNKVFKVKEMMFGFDDVFDYFECSKCGCLQITEIPLDMSKYYPSNYYSFNEIKNSTTNRMKRILGKERDRYAFTGSGFVGRILNNIYPAHHIDAMIRANVNIDSRILDVGCGSGNLLRSLNDIEFMNLNGVDPYIEEDIEYDNVKIIKKHIIDLDADEFDLIMFNHSFEHIPDQKETLNSVYRLLSENGVCIIRIPTVSSFAWEKYNVNWVQLDAPRHFFLHSINSIKLLALNSGLILKDYFYDSTAFQFWGSEQYLRGNSLNSVNSYGKNPKKSIFSKHEIKSFKEKAKDLNDNKLGDQVTLYFAKI